MTVRSTRFTELVGCRAPLQLAAMGGGVTTADLVTAVCRAGGLGMLQRGLGPSFVRRLGEIADADVGPFGVNFVPPLGQGGREEIELAASRAALVEHFWADPDPALVSLVHEAGALASWQVGSVEEARLAAEAGCDFVVAQGVEAGGHVRGTTPLLELLVDVLAAVEVPVVAAGGIATRRAAEAAFAAGADAIRVGTAFSRPTSPGRTRSTSRRCSPPGQPTRRLRRRSRSDGPTRRTVCSPPPSPRWSRSRARRWAS